MIEGNNLSPCNSAGGISSQGHEDLPQLHPQKAQPSSSPMSPCLQSPTSSTGPYERQNHVSTANLYSVSIVCLWIDGKERLCLAQISNTLLKDYSYNEIHNRRVALGITCVQCTPVQLEILRRAGAMPVSSRRCGMITKREAERLVKSFLEEMAPPKLPDDFAFDVSHGCGWGCRGSFIPSRYNSSRAKCVKCFYCNMYFSPNKFIFHFHRMPDSKYQHPDAANFNSWRRHLVITDTAASDDMMHAWEDVKAMFNGGSRKRVMASSAQSFTKNQDHSNMKRSKMSLQVPREEHHHQAADSKHLLSGPGVHRYPAGYPFAMFPTAGSTKPLPTPKPLPILGQPFPEKLTRAAPHHFPPHLAGAPFASAPNTVYPSYEMIWAKHLGISMYNENSCYPPRCIIDAATDNDLTEKNLSPRSPDKEPSVRGHAFSAFKPVSSVGLFKPYADLETSQDCSSDHESAYESPVETDTENIDVDTVEDAIETCKSSSHINVMQAVQTRMQGVEAADQATTRESVITSYDKPMAAVRSLNTEICVKDSIDKPDVTYKGAPIAESPPKAHQKPIDIHENHTDCEKRLSPGITDKKCDTNANCLDYNEQSHINVNHACPISPQDGEAESGIPILENLSKVELQEELATALKTRRKVEEEFHCIKSTFESQVCGRENSHREDLSEQIHVVSESLYTQLEHERKTRATLQLKLREAQDAISKFSYKMLDAGQC